MTSTPGRFLVVGIGPGDPELITRKAERLIGAAPVVAFHAGVRKDSHARRIAADLIPAEAIEEELRYPVTTGATDHPGGYVGALADFYDDEVATQLKSITSVIEPAMMIFVGAIVGVVVIAMYMPMFSIFELGQ